MTWARRADDSPFTTLGLLDRMVYDNPEPLVMLAALAGATTRFRLQTEVLIAPVHNTAVLAKQTATLDRLSGGRFTLGIGVGGREDDCLAAGVDAWAGQEFGAGVGPIGPSPATGGGPEVLFGGFAAAAIERVALGRRFLGAAYRPSSWTSCSGMWSKSGRRSSVLGCLAWSPRSMPRSGRSR